MAASSSFFFCPQLQTSFTAPLLLRTPATTQHLAVFMFLLLILAQCWLGLRQPLGNLMKPTERGEELGVSTDASSYSAQTHSTSRKPAHQHHSGWVRADFQAVVVYFFGGGSTSKTNQRDLSLSLISCISCGLLHHGQSSSEPGTWNVSCLHN